MADRPAELEATISRPFLNAQRLDTEFITEDEAAALEALAELVEIARAARKALFFCWEASGADTDGATSTDDIGGADINGLAMNGVAQLRDDYDECPTPEDLAAAEARAVRAEAALRDLNARCDDLAAATRDPIDQNYIAILRDNWDALFATLDRIEQAGLLGSAPVSPPPEEPIARVALGKDSS